MRKDGGGTQAEEGPRGAIPELLRRFMTAGFSGLFTTEATIRKALGDTVPQDWVDFAISQSDKTRAEFFDRMATEFGQVIERIDLAEIAGQLLEGRTLEVTIRLSPPESSDDAAQTPTGPRTMSVSVRDGD